MLLARPFEDSTGGLAIVECADAKEAQASWTPTLR